MIDFLKRILCKLDSGKKPDDFRVVYYDALIRLNNADTPEWKGVKEQYLRDFAQCLSLAMQSADSNAKLAIETLLKARVYHDLIYTAQNAGDLKKEVVAKTAQQKIQNEAAKNLFKE